MLIAFAFLGGLVFLIASRFKKCGPSEGEELTAVVLCTGLAGLILLLPFCAVVGWMMNGHVSFLAAVFYTTLLFVFFLGTPFVLILLSGYLLSRIIAGTVNLFCAAFGYLPLYDENQELSNGWMLISKKQEKIHLEQRRAIHDFNRQKMARVRAAKIIKKKLESVEPGENYKLDL